ncbi:hypothetical protein [Bacillus cabrialesii]|uniref:Uncharacterized protein n=1 Tax=Bacillus cabrialesii subsp. tritici TaxID=2944916 RepID=A0ABT9DRG0_9BACI|nr:hypothetical protein [Bacillus cabrialesii]MDO8227298.1 hypothetical protein [Bacillus cabrialesii subsp. tritici]
MSISGATPILFQHIKKWRFYRETDHVLDAIYSIELAAVYHSRTIVVIFKDVSGVTIREIETISGLSDGLLHIETQPQGMYLVEEWEEETFSFYCRQYEVREVE